MRLIKPSYEIITEIDAVKIYTNIEKAGRLSWKSEGKMTDHSYEKFIPMILSKNHESVIEHESISVKFIVDRGVSHELVRHRLASFTQESTRYCNYTSDKFDNEITFIIPEWLTIIPGWTLNKDYDSEWCHEKDKLRMDGTELWISAMAQAEVHYFYLIDKKKWTPQQARTVLPNSLKTEIVITANLREWRHIFALRAGKAAHPQMSEVMLPLFDEFKEKLPLLFNDDIGIN